MGYDLKKCLSGYLRGIFGGDGRIPPFDLNLFKSLSFIYLKIL